MTLDELQAEFPLGALVSLDRGGIGRVVGYDHDKMDARRWRHVNVPCVLVDDGAATVRWAVERVERMPNRVPCPITEPTTIHHIDAGGGIWDTQGPYPSNGGKASVTLHPAEPGATEGRYTWERPS
jgi:hypothetical protein